MRVEIDVIGDEDIVRKYAGIEGRLRNAKPAFRDVLDVIEQGEREHFKRLGGKYVRTGDLMASLTQPHANDAIRDVHSDGGGLTFGTSVFYGRFLRKHSSASEGGSESAVLVLQPKTKRLASEVIMDHIMGRRA